MVYCQQSPVHDVVILALAFVPFLWLSCSSSCFFDLFLSQLPLALMLSCSCRPVLFPSLLPFALFSLMLLLFFSSCSHDLFLSCSFLVLSSFFSSSFSRPLSFSLSLSRPLFLDLFFFISSSLFLFLSFSCSSPLSPALPLLLYFSRSPALFPCSFPLALALSFSCLPLPLVPSAARAPHGGRRDQTATIE